MALVLADRVKETTTTTGTGTITLAGAVTGFQSFSVVGNANTTYYCIAGQGTSEWEVGIGTYTAAGTTLSRGTVLASSNAGALVNFSAGTKDVFVTYPATYSVTSQSPTLVSATLSGNTTGSDGLLTRVALQDTGWDWYDSGTTNALDYVNGSAQRWAPATGAQTLTVTNWPASGVLGELLIEGINLLTATITWPTINWVLPAGTTTTNINTYLNTIGRTLQVSGTDWVLLWTRDAGTTVYGKLL